MKVHAMIFGSLVLLLGIAIIGLYGIEDKLTGYRFIGVGYMAYGVFVGMLSYLQGGKSE